MNKLKDRAMKAPCIRPIDYQSGHKVILAIDSSYVAVGWILLQYNDDGQQIPSRYGSITWNSVQAKYSQAKLEFFGLFRALHAARLYLIGLPTFTVEMDAKYVKGMLNHPDMQPNAAVNRWIAAIQMLDF